MSKWVIDKWRKAKGKLKLFKQFFPEKLTWFVDIISDDEAFIQRTEKLKAKGVEGKTQARRMLRFRRKVKFWTSDFVSNQLTVVISVLALVVSIFAYFK